MNGAPITVARPEFPTLRRTAHAGPGMAGLSLVEVMIALALGLVIIAALGQLYAGGRQSYVLSDALARLDENGRFTVDFLANDIRMAGYLSCGGASARIGNSVNAAGSWVYETRGLGGYEGGVSPLPADFTGQVRAGTDVLIVRRAAQEFERAVLRDNALAGVMTLGVDHGFQVGEVLVIANPSCSQASLFQVTATLNLEHAGQSDKVDAIKYGLGGDCSPGNCTRALFGNFNCAHLADAETAVFRPHSVVSRFAVHAYYVTASDPPILVRKRLTQANGQALLATEELIRDVENFQVLYGRASSLAGSAAGIDYVTANLVTDWSAVVSVRFALLMRSREEGVRSKATSQPYDMLGETLTTPTDRRIRRSLAGVVAVRNHLP